MGSAGGEGGCQAVAEIHSVNGGRRCMEKVSVCAFPHLRPLSPLSCLRIPSGTRNRRPFSVRDVRTADILYTVCPGVKSLHEGNGRARRGNGYIRLSHSELLWFMEREKYPIVAVCDKKRRVGNAFRETLSPGCLSRRNPAGEDGGKGLGNCVRQARRTRTVR